MRGRLVFQLDTTLTGVSFQHDSVDEVVGRGAIADVHDQRLILSETRLTTEYGVADGLGLSLMIPVRAVDVAVRYLDAATRAPVQLVAPNIHHRDETLSGLGDLWLQVHLATAVRRWIFHWRFGLSLPTGQTFDDPFLLGDEGLPHEHIQLGLGTVTPLVGFEAQRAFARFAVGAWTQLQPVLYAGANGWRAGDRYAAGAYAQSGFGLARWTFQLGVDFTAETAERWHGRIPPDEGNRGRADLLLSGAAICRVTPSVQLFAAARVPVFVYVSGAQLSYPLVGTVGVTGYYDLARRHAHDDDDDDDHHHHDHDHDHGTIVTHR